MDTVSTNEWMIPVSRIEANGVNYITSKKQMNTLIDTGTSLILLSEDIFENLWVDHFSKACYIFANSMIVCIC